MNKRSSNDNPKSGTSSNARKNSNYFSDTFGKKTVKTGKSKFEDSGEDKRGARFKDKSSSRSEGAGYKRRSSDESSFDGEKQYKKSSEQKRSYSRDDKFSKEGGFKPRRNDGERSFSKDDKFSKEGGFKPRRNDGERSFSKDDKFSKEGAFKPRRNDGERSFSKDDKFSKDGGFKPRRNDEGRSFSNEKRGTDERKFSKDSFSKDGKRFDKNENFKAKKFDGEGAFPKRTYEEGERKFSKDSHFESRKPRGSKRNDEGKPNQRQESRIRKYFDNENDHEKAYSSNEYAGRRKNSFNPNSKRPVDTSDEDKGSMPLNKYVAHCGVCSRRDAVALIKDGKIKVNGEVVTEPGTKMQGDEKVEMAGKVLSPQKNLVYILMNKPKGYITTTDDPKGRRTVMDILFGLEQRVFPVGRLDRNTTGILLLTNDGELAQKLSHPKHAMRKIYQVTLDRALSQADFDKVKAGVVLEDGKAEVDEIEYLEEKNMIGLEIHSGKNRIVRRIFEAVGYTVDKLDRVMYAGLTKKNVLRGKWRFLTQQEVINLKHLH